MPDDDIFFILKDGVLRRITPKQIRRAVFLILALAAAVYFLARPTRDAIKGWQSRRKARTALEFLDQGKFEDARRDALAAYQLRPTEPQGLRAVARFLSRTRQIQAFDFWDQLEKLQPLNRDDLRDEAAIALVTGETGRAASAIDRLLAADGKEATPQDWMLASQLRLLQGAPKKALEVLQKIFANTRATPREQLQATLLQLQAARSLGAPDEGAEKEAWQRIGNLGRSDDAAGLDALVLLAQRQLMTPPGTGGAGSATEEDASGLSPNELIARVQSHPLSKTPQKLLAVDLQIHAQPEKKDALIEQAIEQFKGGDSSQLAILATWLNGRGEYQRTLDVIPLERALQARETFLQHMDALGALGRWADIKHLLDGERYPLEPVFQSMYMARCNTQLGQEAAAQNNWQRALEAGAGDAEKLMALGEYAEKNGALETADAAYAAAIHASSAFRKAWQGRLRMASASRETKRIQAILAEMLALWPRDSAIQNDDAYLRLLLLSGSSTPLKPEEKSATGDASTTANEELVAIEKLARGLVERYPNSLPHRTLLALALLKQNRPVAALQVYDAIQVSQNVLTPSALAVHAAVLAANGQRDAAREEIGHVPGDKLLPEEQALVAALR